MELANEVEGIISWGAKVDNKQGESQSCMDMILAIQKTFQLPNLVLRFKGMAKVCRWN